ncbi:flagellar protein FlgN [Stutzerimonas urumqiensis]|uniref:flagella synthesis protein FlgN n=1 Tax=Stutzerimonas urumqiensis TaxID=638269 RepID=UPI003DA390FC
MQQALIKQLDEDIQLAQQLIALADEEFEALAQRDLQALEDLLARKQPLLALLGQHGKERTSLLTGNRLPASREGLVQLLKGSDDAEEVLSRADDLQALLERCRTANQRNGRLIGANQAVVEKMIGLLKGAPETPSLYDRKGGTTRSYSNKPLSQA